MIASLLIALVFAAQHEKIVNGYLDGDLHPHGCALAGPNNVGHNYAHCSCYQIAPNLVLTAPHCSWSGRDERTVVSFESHLADVPGRWPGIYYELKQRGGYEKGLYGGWLYCGQHDGSGKCLDGDVPAIVVLDTRAPWPISGTPRLPRLNELEKDLHGPYDIVGFGVTDHKASANDGAKDRRWGVASYRARSEHTIKIGGQSHACWSDSGGAVLAQDADGRDVLIGEIYVGDENCSDWDRAIRNDTQIARDFLSQFMEVP